MNLWVSALTLICKCSDAPIVSDEADLRIQLAASQKAQDQLYLDCEGLKTELQKTRTHLQASQADAVSAVLGAPLSAHLQAPETYALQEDVLRYRQTDLDRAEQQVAKLEANLEAMQQAADSTGASYEDLRVPFCCSLSRPAAVSAAALELIAGVQGDFKVACEKLEAATEEVTELKAQATAMQEEVGIYIIPD